MLESLRVLARPLLQIKPTCIQQSVRTTFKLKRHFPYKKIPKMTSVLPLKLKRKDFVFDFIEYESAMKKKPIDLILLKYVEGIGVEGDVVSVHPTQAYEELLLPGLAVYANEENIKKYAHKTAVQTYSSKYVGECLRLLSTHLVHVLMSDKNTWTIEPWHIRVALRREGIVVPEEAIQLVTTISGPDPALEMKEFPVKITINQKESVWVRCRLYHWNRAENCSNFKVFYYTDQDNNKVCEPISQDVKEILDSMPRPILKERSYVPDAPWML